MEIKANKTTSIIAVALVSSYKNKIIANDGYSVEMLCS